MTPRRRIALLMAVVTTLIALFSTSAWAQDTTLREKVESAMRKHDLELAVEVLDEALAESGSPTVLIHGARASLDLLPSAVGNRRAAAFAKKALEKGGAKNTEVWNTATAVRRRLLEERDVEVGAEFLRLLMSQFEKESLPLIYRYNLAELLQDGSRQREALAAFEAIVSDHPLEVTAVLRIAEIREDRGDVDGAVEAFDELLAAAGPDARSRGVLLAHLNRASIRLHKQRDFEQAEKDLAEGRAVLESLPAGALRDQFENLFSSEDKALVERRQHADNVRERIAHVELALVLTIAWLSVVLAGGIVLGRKYGAL